jgi:hypothetical protein
VPDLPVCHQPRQIIFLHLHLPSTNSPTFTSPTSLTPQPIRHLLLTGIHSQRSPSLLDLPNAFFPRFAGGGSQLRLRSPPKSNVLSTSIQYAHLFEGSTSGSRFPLWRLSSRRQARFADASHSHRIRACAALSFFRWARACRMVVCSECNWQCKFPSTLAPIF